MVLPKLDAMQCEQGGHVRVEPEIPGLLGAVKGAASAGARLVDPTTPRGAEIRTTPVYKGEYRPVIQEHAPVAGAAASLTFNARKFYHSRRANSAAIGAWRVFESAVDAAWRLMIESRGPHTFRRSSPAPAGSRTLWRWWDDR